jgi:hypothetical protein
MFLLTVSFTASIVYASSNTESDVQSYSLIQSTVYQQNRTMVPVDFSLKKGVGNGYCVDLVKYYRDIPWSGNAKEYYQNAIDNGFNVGNRPQINAIWVSTKGTYGHVAMVTETYNDSFKIIEQNVRGRYIISTRIIENNDNYLFIY